MEVSVLLVASKSTIIILFFFVISYFECSFPQLRLHYFYNFVTLLITTKSIVGFFAQPLCRGLFILAHASKVDGLIQALYVHIWHNAGSQCVLFTNFREINFTKLFVKLMCFLPEIFSSSFYWIFTQFVIKNFIWLFFEVQTHCEKSLFSFLGRHRIWRSSRTFAFGVGTWSSFDQLSKIKDESVGSGKTQVNFFEYEG